MPKKKEVAYTPTGVVTDMIKNLFPGSIALKHLIATKIGSLVF